MKDKIPASKPESVEDILSIAKENHRSLMKKLNSKEKKKYVGNWVAVANKKIFVTKTYKKAVHAALKIQPSINKILVTRVPDKPTGSLRF